MPHSRIKELLKQAEQAIKKGDAVSNEELKLIQQLQDDIEIRLSKESITENQNLIENLTRAETEFAVRYPVAERCIREVIDALAKMGI